MILNIQGAEYSADPAEQGSYCVCRHKADDHEMEMVPHPNFPQHIVQSAIYCHLCDCKQPQLTRYVYPLRTCAGCTSEACAHPTWTCRVAAVRAEAAHLLEVPE